MTRPSDNEGWTDRAVRWVDKHNAGRARPLEYFSGPTLMWRTLKNKQQIARLRVVINSASPLDDIYLIGHSNGADIICSCLGTITRRIEGVTLIAAATEHNFNKNNLNKAFKEGRLGNVLVLCSSSDGVLKNLARPSRFIFGKFGYGYLGYQAAVDRLSLNPAGKTEIIDCKGFGHGDYFKEPHMDWTMQQIIRNTKPL